MLRALVLLGACIAVLTTPRPSRACSCHRTLATVSPAQGVEAPLNTQVRIAWSINRYEKPFFAEKSQVLVLVDKTGAVVAVDRRVWTSGSTRTLVLTPKRPLAPKTTYEVRASAGIVVGTFTTGSARDDTAPKWRGVAKATAFMNSRAPNQCRTGEMYVVVELGDGEAGPSDDRTPFDALAFAIWPAKGKLDAASLLAIVPNYGAPLVLGNPSTCSPNNFSLVGKQLAVRIAPIDLAGNVGDPADVIVDLSNPTAE
jgi:hypothetical protein